MNIDKPFLNKAVFFLTVFIFVFVIANLVKDRDMMVSLGEIDSSVLRASIAVVSSATDIDAGEYQDDKEKCSSCEKISTGEPNICLKEDKSIEITVGDNADGYDFEWTGLYAGHDDHYLQMTFVSVKTSSAFLSLHRLGKPIAGTKVEISPSGPKASLKYQIIGQKGVGSNESIDLKVKWEWINAKTGASIYIETEDWHWNIVVGDIEKGKCIKDCRRDGGTCTKSAGGSGICGEGVCKDKAECKTDAECSSDYFCYKSKCIEKTCQNLFGNTEKCDPTDKVSELNCCCSKDEETGNGGCCYSAEGKKLSSAYKPPCCDKNESCNNFEFFTGNLIFYPKLILSFCSPNSCNDPDKELVCKGGPDTLNFCCDKGDTCLQYYNPNPPGTNNPLKMYTSLCGKPKTKDGNKCLIGKESACPSDPLSVEKGEGKLIGEGTQCCVNSYQTCTKANNTNYPVPLCVAKIGAKRPGYTFCMGEGRDWDWASRWCRNGFETCIVQATGQPTCFNSKKLVGNPSFTSSTSVYIVREKNRFSINGEAYIVEPSMELKQPIEIFMDYSDFLTADVETYKYSDHDNILAGCDSELLDGVTETIGLFGGEVSMDGMEITIPYGALLFYEDISIKKYNLSNCYSPEANHIDQIAGAIDVLNELDNAPTGDLITTCQELQDIRNNLVGDYILADDIDCSGTKEWYEGKGFEPIGNPDNPFAGTIEGNGSFIDGLYINRPDEDGVGLFGALTGSVNNFELSAEIIGRSRVGSIAGYNKGEILEIASEGSVRGDTYTGGLIGINHTGNIINSFSEINVTGDAYLGGLVGYNSLGRIEKSYSTGTITANGLPPSPFSLMPGNTSQSGGLVGVNDQGEIRNSFFSGSFVNDFYDLGGIASHNYHGTIENSYWNDSSVTTDKCFFYSSGTTSCNFVETDSYFFDIRNAPIGNWAFPPWSNANDKTNYPYLGESVTDPEIAEISITDETAGEFLPVGKGWGQILLSWEYSNDKNHDQKGYQIQVSTDSGFSNLIVDDAVSQTVFSSEEGSSSIVISESPTSKTDDLIVGFYGESNPLYWRIRIKDSQNNWSDWSVGPIIPTPKHAYPWVNIDYFASPDDETMINFTDQSEVFSDDLGYVRSWDFGDGFPHSNLDDIVYTYPVVDSYYKVILTITDSDGYKSKRSFAIPVGNPVKPPSWIETSPF